MNTEVPNSIFVVRGIMLKVNEDFNFVKKT